MYTYKKFVIKLRLARMLVWRILRVFRVVVFLVFYAGASAYFFGRTFCSVSDCVLDTFHKFRCISGFLVAEARSPCFAR